MSARFSRRVLACLLFGLATTQALAQTPDIRADQVARAKELVKQSDYPPAEMVRKIGELLAGHLSNR